MPWFRAILSRQGRPAPPAGAWRGRLWLGLLAGALGVGVAQGQTLETLAGGRRTAAGQDWGFTDGDSKQQAQFNAPSGCLLAANGSLLVADRNNGAVRRLDLEHGQTATVITRLNQPVALAQDGARNIYVLNEGDGTVLKYGPLDTQFRFPGLVVGGLHTPTAFALDNRTNLLVTELGGVLKQVNLTNGAVTEITRGLQQPRGIAVLDSGLLAVSESGAHVLRLVNPLSGVWASQIGVGEPGFRDGGFSDAQFSEPWQLAKAPGGALVVADRLNQRVRVVSADGMVTTLYGVYPYEVGEPCLDCHPIILPGWLDGSALFAEAREPIGVTVTDDGVVYTAELFYHLVRRVTGTGLSGGAGPGGGGSTNVLVLPPTVGLLSGYFPMGADIPVVNANTNLLLSNRVFYTTDGSEPGPNNAQSRLVDLTNGVGVIRWREPAADLASLRVKAFVGDLAGPTVSGQAATNNTVGFPSDVSAGPGATVMVPIVANLRPGVTLRSVQFLAQVSPVGAAPAMAAPVRALTVSASDFVVVAVGSSNAPIVRSETSGGVARLELAYVGTNAAFTVRNFGTLSVLAVSLPGAAALGDTYKLSLLSPSGTSDAAQDRVELTNLASRTITIKTTQYVVGDTAPGAWYNAGDFGDGRLENGDVNNAFYASLGVRVPPAFTDVFDAMDSFPEDTPDAVGGDGKIRFLDWQILLDRSLGFRTDVWTRSWVGGLRLASPVGSGGAPSFPGDSVPPGPSVALALLRADAELSAGSMDQAEPGAVVGVPLRVALAPGARLAGMQFRVAVEPLGSAPAVAEPVEFAAADGLPLPFFAAGLRLSEVGAAWALRLNSFLPALTGSREIGRLRFRVPPSAGAGDGYRLRLLNADGAADMQRAYAVETYGGIVAVRAAAATTRARSVELRWGTVPGQRYVVESTTRLPAGPWTVEAADLLGRGRPLSFVDPNPTDRAKYYRVRATP